MRTNNTFKNHSGRFTAIFVITGAIIGAAADITFGLPLLGTSVGAAFGLWIGAAVESVAQTIAHDMVTA